ncbi:hypothetical protein KKG48_01180 [Patescibacteria group bacterium]|nr:hypothetical protein [Patescibacteria group bacterium]MCG2695130.1 hypothetical protein [Candidatus Parcubacteria bacterium]
MIFNKKRKMNSLKPFLWSYNTNEMDFYRDKRRIITNVLNLGTKKATDLIFKIYDENSLKEVVANPLPGEWNKKSLNYWQLIFNIENPKELKRNVL